MAVYFLVFVRTMKNVWNNNFERKNFALTDLMQELHSTSIWAVLARTYTHAHSQIYQDEEGVHGSHFACCVTLAFNVLCDRI